MKNFIIVLKLFTLFLTVSLAHRLPTKKLVHSTESITISPVVGNKYQYQPSSYHHDTSSGDDSESEEMETPQSTLKIPYQIAKDLNKMINLSYWTTRTAFVRYFTGLKTMIDGRPTLVIKEKQGKRKHVKYGAREDKTSENRIKSVVINHGENGYKTDSMESSDILSPLWDLIYDKAD